MNPTATQKTLKEVIELALGQSIDDEDVIHILVDCRRQIKRCADHNNKHLEVGFPVIAALRKYEIATGKKVL